MNHVKSWKLFESEEHTKSRLLPIHIKFLNECTEGTWSINPQTDLIDIDGNFHSHWGNKKYSDFEF
jgi:hypothetical protein